jgi:predicted transcriptional regulator of viral defense system
MNSTSALSRLTQLGKPVFTTEDAALSMRATRSAASRTLSRLAAAGLIQRVRHGMWTLERTLDCLSLAEHLTAPLPSYVSFQTALYLHAMISQIPTVTYVASLARTKRLRTRFGTFSIHQLAPRFFGGYMTVVATGANVATPEKALVDTLYLGQTRSRLFAHLPEVELPRGFDRKEAERWVRRIAATPRRLAVSRRLDRLFASPRTARPGSGRRAITRGKPAQESRSKRS